jgi:hypothetical protein
MSETTVDEKKVVGRSVAVALGIICIILVAGLAGTLIVLNSQITSLQIQSNEWSNIANLNESEIWANNQTITIAPYNSYMHQNYVEFIERTIYSGYVEIDLQANTTLYYFQIQYQYAGQRFYIQRFETFNSYDTYFPIASLPNSLEIGFAISIYNNSTGFLKGYLTITYYY